MRKTFHIILTVLYGLVFLTETPLLAWELGSQAPISAQSAILLDPSTNKVLFAKRPELTRPSASTTKVLTALVVLERMSLNQVVRVPASAEYIPPTKVYLRRGERFYAKDLLRALLLNSANDAAHTLAVAAAGSEAAFARLMNQKARRIGCRHTRFVNASGLPHPGGQYTTVYDLALIMKHARRNKFISQALGQRTGCIRALTGRTVYLRNHNKMLWRNPHRIEGKTGYTRSARHCFVGKIRAPRRGDVLVAIMGSNRLWHDLTVLLGLTHSLDPLQKQFNSINLSRKEIADLQRGLWYAGFPTGVVDGAFGSRTLRALKAFQKSRGLEPDGIVGSRTWSKLQPFMNR